MKRILSLLAAVMLICSLCSCGETKTTDSNIEQNPSTENNETTQNNGSTQNDQSQDTSNVKEAAVGDILDAPEITFDDSTEEVYIYYTSPDANDASKVNSIEFALKQMTDDMYVIYMSDGLLKNHEIVYEVDDNGITKYFKDALMEKFEKETELSDSALENEKDELFAMFTYFTLDHPDYANCKYQKSDAIPVTLTGDAFVYDLLENGNKEGQVCIDKKTGLLVSLKDAQGNSVYTVQKISTSGVEVPSYK